MFVISLPSLAKKEMGWSIYVQMQAEADPGFENLKGESAGGSGARPQDFVS